MMQGIGSGIVSSVENTLDATGDYINKQDTSSVLRCMSIFNLLNGIGIIVGGVIILVMLPECYEIAECPSASMAVIGFYTIIFGLLLVMFEGRIGRKYKSFMRKNFGFMYSYGGRTVFLLFLATMLYSTLYTGFSLYFATLVVAIITSLNAIFNCFVIYRHPGFKNGNAPPPLDEIIHDDEDVENNNRGVELEEMNESPFSIESVENKSGGNDNPFMSDELAQS